MIADKDLMAGDLVPSGRTIQRRRVRRLGGENEDRTLLLPMENKKGRECQKGCQGEDRAAEEAGLRLLAKPHDRRHAREWRGQEAEDDPSTSVAIRVDPVLSNKGTGSSGMPATAAWSCPR